MQNYVSAGDTVSVTAPYALATGAGALVGSLFGVAVAAYANAAAAELKTTGVFTLAKTTGTAWSVGDKLYWDDSAKSLTKTASGNTLVGVCTLAAASGDATGQIRLNGSF